MDSGPNSLNFERAADGLKVEKVEGECGQTKTDLTGEIYFDLGRDNFDFERARS